MARRVSATSADLVDGARSAEPAASGDVDARRLPSAGRQARGTPRGSRAGLYAAARAGNRRPTISRTCRTMPGRATPLIRTMPRSRYPKQYSPTAWPFIGPFYPYPQVPLGWRKVTWNGTTAGGSSTSTIAATTKRADATRQQRRNHEPRRLTRSTARGFVVCACMRCRGDCTLRFPAGFFRKTGKTRKFVQTNTISRASVGFDRRAARTIFGQTRAARCCHAGHEKICEQAVEDSVMATKTPASMGFDLVGPGPAFERGLCRRRRPEPGRLRRSDSRQPVLPGQEGRRVVGQGALRSRAHLGPADLGRSGAGTRSAERRRNHADAGTGPSGGRRFARCCTKCSATTCGS